MPGPVREAREGFAVELDPAAGGLRLCLADGPTLSIAPPETETAPGSGRLLARGRVKGPAGGATRLELQALAPGSGLRRVVEVPEDGSGLVVEAPTAAAHGTRRDARRTRTLLALQVPSSAGLEARPFALGGPEDRLVELGGAGGPPRLLVGLVGGARRGALRVEHGEGGGLLVRAVDPAPPPAAAAAGEDDEVPPRVWIGVGSSETALRAAWAARAGAELGARAPAHGGVSWPGARPAPALPDVAPVRLAAPRDEPPGPGAWRLAGSGPWRPLVGRADAVRVADPLRHAFASRRLWLNAVGPVDLHDPDAARLRTALALAGLAGGLVVLAEAPADLPPERLALLRATLPPLAREADALDDATLRVPLLGGRLAILRVHRGEEPGALGLDLRALGLEGPQRVFDFFAGRDLGWCRDRVAPEPTPPGGCRLLGLTPPFERPCVVGSTLHVGLGTLEVAALRGGGDAPLRLVLRHPGAHRGAVFVGVPGEAQARRVDVAFRDALEVEVPEPPAARGRRAGETSPA